MNKLFYNACERIEQHTPPIWYMRQAGRYHSHYQELKKSYTFEQLCKTPELAAEVACGPVKEFDLDVAIMFSDIMFVLEGLGMELQFDPGPKFVGGGIHGNVQKAIEHMKFQADVIKATRERLDNNVSLIGFVGGPYTVTAHLMKRTFVAGIQNKPLEWLKNVMVPLLKANIDLQLEAGAEKVMIFDSTLDIMNLWYWEKEYIPLLEPLVGDNVGYYCKNRDILKATHYPWGGVGIDGSQSMSKVLMSRDKGFVQGNFKEKYLLLPKKELQEKIDMFCDYMELRNRLGWVCGLGHGIDKETPEENVHLFIDTIRKRFQ